ncbi:Uma2 family endonuclease [Sphaerospermopsis sp. FACHB-1194]|uniref:Uma2 family endonuclease n=1 Tax=Sphaerospermopsis sp. FACHB-1194 TaxID=2692862 RepID=UPI001680AAAD|nr:Uma2 family endonuclease [Sphaerospermopsis sp. FACHB-1194]MBD2146476.1 Uma2 family endonuclease [Sphaerospermopsis sp. FACHB-1194]
MVQTPAQIITLEQFLQLPETEPASEYIDGSIIQKPMPQGEHSVIQTELSPAINLILKPQKIARAFSELRCTFGGRSIVPDISVFCWDKIPRQENGRVANVFAIAPDWTIEILSPDQSQTKVIKKVIKNILHCLNYGTQMGWLIDPQEQSIFVYFPDQPTAFYDQPNARLPVPEFAKDFHLTVKELFDWLLE